jgi:hypothetical protein
MKWPLKTHSRFLSLERSQVREFRVAQKSGHDTQRIKRAIEARPLPPAGSVTKIEVLPSH